MIQRKGHVLTRPAHAAGMMQAADSDVVPKVLGGCSGAADGQHSVSVTTGEPIQRTLRIMAVDAAIDGR